MNHARNLKHTWRRRLAPGLLDAGFHLVRAYAGRPGGKRGDANVRWLELRDKITAYRLFAGRNCGGQLEPLKISRLEPYARLFAVEGYSYRNGKRGTLATEAPSELSAIAIHAGAGLRLAEQALEDIDAGKCERDLLAEFLAICKRDAREGFGGIMEESLGLVARTLYPHLMERLDERLGLLDAVSRARFWHGAGRGIYFAPSNLPPYRAAPWKGVGMCLSEPPDETGKRNALSGFCFALTLVNLPEPEVLATFLKHHADETANCVDGIQAANAVWLLCGGGREITGPLAAHAHRTRVRWPLLWPGGVADEDRRRPEHLFSARPGSETLARAWT